MAVVLSLLILQVTYSGEEGCVPVFDEPVEMDNKTFVALASWPGFLSDPAVESQHFIGASKFRRILPVPSTNGAATPATNGTNGHVNGGHLDGGSTYGYVPNGHTGPVYSGNATHIVAGWHQARIAWVRYLGPETPAVYAIEYANIRLTYARRGKFWDVLTQNQASSAWKITGIDIQSRWCEGPTKNIFRFDQNGSFADFYDSAYTTENSSSNSDGASMYAPTTHSKSKGMGKIRKRY